MFAWRNYLEVHPAADDYPLLKDSDPAAFRELVEDIRKHGLRANIVLWEDNDGKRLLDGRNRLDALAELGVLYDDIDGELGLKSWTGTKWAQLSGDKIQFQHLAGGDPYALAASLQRDQGKERAQRQVDRAC
jgi:ParB-like nuclease domain